MTRCVGKNGDEPPTREGSCHQPQTTASSLVSGVSGSGVTPIADRLHRSIYRILAWWCNTPDLSLMTATFTTPQVSSSDGVPARLVVW